MTFPRCGRILASPNLSQEVEQTVRLRFNPRSYQLPLLRFHENGGRRSIAVWHRRAGKDLTMWNYTIGQALEQPGIYYFFYPTYSQGKKILWKGMDSKGVRFRDYIPREVRDHCQEHETEMRIEFPNGSIVQIIGSENIDSIVGTNPRGCVFSEYALQDPKGWDYVRPILAENRGWASFIYTPRGHNHSWRLFEAAKRLSGTWFAQILTIADTRRDAPGEDGTPVITPEQVQEEVDAGMDPDLAQQEFYCSFAGSLQGAYYARQLQTAREQKRLTFVPYDPKLPVHTAWDLGLDDATSVWFVQVEGKAIYLVDHYEESGLSLIDHVEAMHKKPYSYGLALMPWDYEHRDLGTGMTRRETVEERFPRFQSYTVPKARIQEGINAVKTIIPRCVWDTTKCERGFDALTSYTKAYDEKNRCFKKTPLHNWASHGADAFRTLAMGIEYLSTVPVQVYAERGFNPLQGEEQSRVAAHDFNPLHD